MSASGMGKPLFDPYLYRALLEVVRGQISAVGSADVDRDLRYRGAPMPARLDDAIRFLHDGGHVTWCPGRGGQRFAELTDDGMQLLVDWMRHAGGKPSASLAAHRTG